MTTAYNDRLGTASISIVLSHGTTCILRHGRSRLLPTQRLEVPAFRESLQEEAQVRFRLMMLDLITRTEGASIRSHPETERERAETALW